MNDPRRTPMASRFLQSALLVAGILGAAQLMFSPVAAQTKSGALRDACMEDYRRFCANVQRGGGRIRQCMLENASQLTPQCRESMKAVQGSKQQ